MKTRNKKWKSPMAVFMIFLVFICILFLQYIYLSLSPSVYGINMQKFVLNRNTYSNTLYAKRGNIYDSENNVLATTVSSYTVIAYLDPSRTGSSKTLYHVVDKENTAKVLSPLLNMSVESIMELLNKDKYQVELGPGGRGISEILKNKIENLNLPGIDFIESFKRYYPNGDFASYLIGYAKKKDIEIEINNATKIDQVLTGELGIEVKYNNELKGIDGYTRYQQDRYGYKIPDTKEETVEAVDGSDIYLTIDSNIQRIIETATDEAEKYSPDWMTINVMDAKTGDILASSSTPSYDPNVLNITNYENPLTSFVYEPGSVMKIYTYMCAIEKGTYKGNDTYTSGKITVEDTDIYDWNVKGWGNITFDYGFEMSSNVAVSYVMQRFLNKQDLYDCFKSYGFGNITDIELPRELSGSLKFNYPVEVAAASYGQGIFTTPIQHLQALSIVANDGYMVKPHIVKKIVNNGKTTYEREVTKTKIVSKTTTDKMQELMYNTVNDVAGNATGLSYKIEGINLMGKTGTAEVYSNERKSYSGGYIYSFSGIFPKEDPQIIVFVSTKNPTSSSAIKKITHDAIESIANYKGMLTTNSGEKAIKKYSISKYVNQNVNDITSKLKANGLNTIVIGDGDVIVDQFPVAGTTALTGDNIILLTNKPNNKMINFIGLSRIEAETILKFLKFDYEIEGNGFVINQNISLNTTINSKIKLILKPKYNIE